MKHQCATVRNRIQLELDGGSTLSDQDLRHVDACPGCSAFYRGYGAFRGSFRAAAATAAAQIGEPGWQEIFHAARPAALQRGFRAVTRRARPPLSRRSSPLLLATAAAIAVVVTGAALYGAQEWRLAAARSFVRQDTVQLVNEIVSSSLYATPSPAAGSGMLGGSSWFEANDLSELLPPSTPQ